jgi:hypothetical protein
VQLAPKPAIFEHSHSTIQVAAVVAAVVVVVVIAAAVVVDDDGACLRKVRC